MASSGGSHYFRAVNARRLNTGVDDVARGMQVGQSIGKLIGGVAGAVKSSQQDAAANALMNAGPTAQANAQAQADPDPDPLVSGEDNLSPDAFNDPSGVQNPTPFSGGVAGMKMQQEFQKSQLADQIQQETLADKIAHREGTGGYAKRATPAPQGVTVSGNSSVWNQPGGSSIVAPQGKAAKYVAGTGDVEEDASTDDAAQIKADFEATHPGLYGKFAGATQRDENGNYIIPGKGKGQQTVDASGNVVTTPPPPEATIPKAEGDLFKMRLDAYKRKAGIPYESSVDLGGKGATADNPVTLTSKLQARALPPGTFVTDGQQVFQIGKKKTQ
jgi:hypothetical protein